jgi:queuine tRNA-ribosyltransferase
MAIRIEILSRSTTCGARLGRVTTPHGPFDTPAFMPVGTQASVKGLLPPLVGATGSQIVLANTYHLMLRPGSALVSRRGGLHPFMGWPGPILTDSGGYQAFSLSATNKVSDDGFVFRSHLDGSLVELTPERAMQVQNDLGADIMMALDDCPPALADVSSPAEYTRRLDEALDRTARWLERCKRAHARPQDQALFGIVQGGIHAGTEFHQNGLVTQRLDAWI